jgi:hypothetical protein
VNGAPVSVNGEITNLTLTKMTFSYGGQTFPCTLTPQLTTATPMPNQDQTVDPVSTASGEFLVPPAADLFLGGPLPLFLRRSYAS